MTAAEPATRPQYTCVATRLRPRGLRVLPVFLAASARARRAAKHTRGNVRTRLLGMPPWPRYFTLTVWESQAAMRDFVGTPEHRAAMALMEQVAKVGSFVEFSSDTAKVGWRTAIRHLDDDSAIHHRPQARSTTRS